MAIHIDEKSWQTAFKGWLITDCAVRDRNSIYLCLQKADSPDKTSAIWYADISTSMVSVFTDAAPPDDFGHLVFDTGFHLATLGVSRPPFSHPQALLVSRGKNGDVWPRGSGMDGPLEYIHQDGDGDLFTMRLKCAANATYAVVSHRRVYKRVAIGQWEPLNAGFPDEERSYISSLIQGFSDLDAFSETDMYAVGGAGDVWHYDGTRWTRMAFPSTDGLDTVTCAGDGNVYISGEGSLWVGKKSTWKSLYLGGSSILWNDVLWFEDKLWLASDYQFRIWNGTELVPVMHAGREVPILGHMDAYDGLLAIASPEYVMTYDGVNWKTIVAPYLS